MPQITFRLTITDDAKSCSEEISFKVPRTDEARLAVSCERFLGMELETLVEAAVDEYFTEPQKPITPAMPESAPVDPE